MGKTLKSFDGTKIYYETMGDHYKARSLIFLHGLGGDLTAWNEERLNLYKHGYSSVAVDLRAHGLSDRPGKRESYSLQNFAQDIKELINKEKIIKPIIVGHCFGGMVAMTLVGQYPEIAKAMILVDTNYKSPFLSHLFLVNYPLHHIFYLAEKIVPGFHLSGHRDFRKYKNNGDYNLIRIATDIAGVSLKNYMMVFEKFMDFNASDWLGKITIPTLVIEGNNDSVFPPEVARALHKRIIKSRIHFIKNANHILLTNNPKELSQAILNFIRMV
ncbi:alpha/beta hydrolase [Candidatus Roizmanbacteria bacterium]|nr:alpha/beta hydrolase [Candidatus Roizmanbacteria bacterium]